MPVLTEDELRELYEVQGKTDKEIAESLGIDRLRITRLRKKYGVETRYSNYKGRCKKKNGKKDEKIEKEIRELYEIQGKTDKEIAKLKGMQRESVSRLRKRLGIQTRPTLSEQALQDVVSKLETLGFTVENVKEDNKTATYDLLLNNRIKIDVRSSSCTEGKRNRIYFRLDEKEETGVVESDTRIKLKSGKYRKLFRKTCDYIIFVGYEGANINFWIMESSDLPDELQTIRLINDKVTDSKYSIYRDAWHRIQDINE
ncbi:hypothetical protein P9X10_02860 [Bacillus cereus]|nr:hypothetical protein [Bacillus cereus]